MTRTLATGTLVLALLVGPPLAAQDAPDLSVGVRQAEEGDFEGAVATLDGVIRTMRSERAPAATQARACLYLGIAHLGLEHAATAKVWFREAVTLDPSLRITADDFPPHVVEAVESARREGALTPAEPGGPAPGGVKPAPPNPAKPAAEPPKKKKGGALFLVLGGGAAAAGVAVAAAGGGGGGGGSPTTTTTQPPSTGPGTTNPGASPSPPPGTSPTTTVPPSTTTPTSSTTTTTTQPAVCDPPAPTLTTDKSGIVSGTITLDCDVPGAVAGCPQRVDFTAVNTFTSARIAIGSDTSTPFSASWDTSTAPIGDYRLFCTSVNGGGNNKNSNNVSVTTTGLLGPRDVMALRTLRWLSRLDVPGGRGQVVLDGVLAVFHGEGVSSGSGRLAGREGRIAAVLVSGSGPGTWRFELGGLPRLGSIRVLAGDAIEVGPAAVSFRLAGRPGERVVFSVESAR